MKIASLAFDLVLSKFLSARTLSYLANGWPIAVLGALSMNRHQYFFTLIVLGIHQDNSHCP